MADLFGSGSVLIKHGNRTPGRIWSEEFECVPLKKRLKMLQGFNRLGEERENGFKPSVDVKKEENDFDSQRDTIVTLAQKEGYWSLTPENSDAGKNNFQRPEAQEYATSNGTNINGATDGAVLVKNIESKGNKMSSSMLNEFTIEEEVTHADKSSARPLRPHASGTCSREAEIKDEVADEFVEDLDHVVLRERKRMLLSRKYMGSMKPVLQGDCSRSSDSVLGKTFQYKIWTGNEEDCSGGAESLVAQNPIHNVLEENTSDFLKSSGFGDLNCVASGLASKVSQGSKLDGHHLGAESTIPEKHGGIQESCRRYSFKKSLITNESPDTHNMPNNPNDKCNTVATSVSVNIKAEPLYYSDVHSVEKDTALSFPSNSVVSVKSEPVPEESCEYDEVDHMLLKDRMLLQVTGEALNFGSLKCSEENSDSVLECRPIASQSPKPIRISRPRKRRRTATDSIETAMEEDAPGLLQVLIDKGVTVDEIKLYGEKESDELIDDSFCEDSFSELEDVISKLFSRRDSVLKLPHLQCGKFEKASYCLACLISLVEQARYLRFRKWPVEWGWCRDLQSFIFVFERHNRIVLERPEYGYATYFFELVDSVPVKWQIKRLMTAMKLSSCSRLNLIENRALMVGEELSEGEARVLMEYGWLPNTGLATMLNYRDRVFHDRKNEKDSSEWRSKIGKILMDGYCGGKIVSTNIPKKVMEYNGGNESLEVKLEPQD